MADFDNKPTKHTKHKISSFLCCFRPLNEGDTNFHNQSSANSTMNTENVGRKKKKKKSKWPSRSMSRVVNTVPEVVPQLPHIPSTASSDQASTPKSLLSTHEFEQNIMIESPQQLPSDSAKDDACFTRLPFTQKIDAIRMARSQPGSPGDNQLKRRRPTLTSHSSFPARLENKRVPTGSILVENGRVQYDPVMGLSIVLVTIVIMLVWGRVCAILCTSAWLYIIPKLKFMVNRSRSNIENGLRLFDLDLNSNEGKKKVVLEGFLRREGTL